MRWSSAVVTGACLAFPAGVGAWLALPFDVGGRVEASPSRSVRDAAPAVLQSPEEPHYNGQFTYVRIRFGDEDSDLRSLGTERRRWGRRRGAPWSHDYPRAEVNFSRIVDATTYIDNYMEGNAGRILELDDPELFRYPIATIIEPGYWQPTQEEVEALRAWLLKGGFLIADDFRSEWELRNLAFHLQRALPDHFIQIVPDDHAVFNSFFAIEDPLALVPPYGYRQPQYLGVFQDNDVERGRIMVMINWNQDLQDYWEFSDRGYYPIDLSNEAYEFGVNYLVYAMTH